MLLSSPATSKKITHRQPASKKLAFVALLLCVFYAFARGFYLPSAWTVNYYLINPFDGFYRRALLGAFLYPFGDLRLHYWFVASVQIAASVILLVAVLRKIYHINQGRGFIYLYLCIFFLSCYGAFFFGITGHPEFVIYFIVFWAFHVKNSVLRALMMCSTVWIHEMAVFTALPLYFAIEHLYFGRKKAAFGTVLLCFIAFCTIYLFFQTADSETITAYKQYISASDYNVIYHYMEIYGHDFLGARLKLNTYYGYYEVLAAAWVPLFPLALACTLAALIYTMQHNWFAAALIFFASATPLIMGFFGWDSCRWIFMAVVNASAIYAVYAGKMDMKRHAAFLLCASTGLAFACIHLFDGREYRTAAEAIQFILHLKEHLSLIPL